MKHGRPFRYYELHGYHDSPRSEGGMYSILLEKAGEFRGGNAQAANTLVRGWRREHAARVFQAIVAVITLACWDELMDRVINDK